MKVYFKKMIKLFKTQKKIQVYNIIEILKMKNKSKIQNN
jgi:hypothetical protein